MCTFLSEGNLMKARKWFIETFDELNPIKIFGSMKSSKMCHESLTEIKRLTESDMAI